jgi:DNA repair exonuclease SbcCD nuclease subunit
MTRVIHTGDTHIGYQQYHSPERRQDFLDAFERVIDDAIDDGVDAVIHAGDLFHDRRPELPDLLGTLSALRRLDAAGVPFLAVVGNHESTRGGQWLDLFERLGLARRLGDEPIVVGEVALYGLDHVPRSRRDDLEYRFEPHDAAHAALVAHGLFEPFAHADWDTETVLAEATVDFDAMLLGDNHVPDTAEVDGTWVAYCGSTERVSASERDGRGYNIVEFGDAVDIRRRSLETRPFAFVDVELGEGEGIERVRERVRQHDLEDAVVVVELSGEGEPVTPATVEEFAVEAGALIARVNDRRELETESELSVSFADPDEAVRERVGEMGLSGAALEVDETVRTGKVADANVREAVKTRVAEVVEDGLDAFEPAPEEPDATGPRTEDASAEDAAPERSDPSADDGGPPADDGDPSDDATDGDATDADDDRSNGEIDADDDRSNGEIDADDDRSANGETDGQVSMEDFL